MTDKEITRIAGWIETELKLIEIERNVRLSDKAFIADCLAPKILQLKLGSMIRED